MRHTPHVLGKHHAHSLALKLQCVHVVYECACEGVQGTCVSKLLHLL